MGDRGPAKRKGAPTAIRFDPALKEALQQAATANGWSLSQEIEERLTRTLTNDAAEGDGARRATESLLWALRQVIERVEELTGAEWQADGFTRDALADAARSLVLFLGPDVDGAAPPPTFPGDFPEGIDRWMDEARREHGEHLIRLGLGEHCAGLVKRAMAMPRPEGEFGALAERIFAAERTLARGLIGLMRIRHVDEKEGGR